MPIQSCPIIDSGSLSGKAASRRPRLVGSTSWRLEILKQYQWPGRCGRYTPYMADFVSSQLSDGLARRLTWIDRCISPPRQPRQPGGSSGSTGGGSCAMVGGWRHRCRFHCDLSIWAPASDNLRRMPRTLPQAREASGGEGGKSDMHPSILAPLPSNVSRQDCACPRITSSPGQDVTGAAMRQGR